jgi:DNA polymerase III subunit delta'
MSFAQLPEQEGSIQLLQRSLARGRLGHAYLFCGSRLERLEILARTLAKTLNCLSPRGGSSPDQPPDCCDHCLNCRKTDEEAHPDVTWIRPESKSRIIRVDQMRDLIRTVNLKPTQAGCKVGIIAGADRLRVEAANAFLKTLEEPPPKSILILLTTDPSDVLETIVSRCLRLNLAGDEGHIDNPAFLAWLSEFAAAAVKEQGSLLSRYRLLSVLLKQLDQLRTTIEKQLEERSPIERYDDLEPALKERWEDELKASIEAEYRRQRSDLMAGLQWWLRDIWLHRLPAGSASPAFPRLESSSKALAGRVSTADAMENLRILERTQWLLDTNVQEALALEVGLLRLKL